MNKMVFIKQVPAVGLEKLTAKYFAQQDGNVPRYYAYA